MVVRSAHLRDLKICTEYGLRHCTRIPGRRGIAHNADQVKYGPARKSLGRRIYTREMGTRSYKNLVCAADTASYVGQLAECEASGDWVRAVELLAEVRILKVDMPTAGYESAIRLCATNGQWQKAVSVVREVRTSQEVSGDTLDHVFSALARERQGRTALDLLQELEETKGWEVHTPETRAAVHNCTIRSCARGGMLEEALALLEKTSQLKMDVHYPTYTTVATACIEAGQEALAEQMLDERDYL